MTAKDIYSIGERSGYSKGKCDGFFTGLIVSFFVGRYLYKKQKKNEAKIEKEGN